MSCLVVLLVLSSSSSPMYSHLSIAIVTLLLSPLLVSLILPLVGTFITQALQCSQTPSSVPPLPSPHTPIGHTLPSRDHSVCVSPQNLPFIWSGTPERTRITLLLINSAVIAPFKVLHTWTWGNGFPCKQIHFVNCKLDERKVNQFKKQYASYFIELSHTCVKLKT